MWIQKLNIASFGKFHNLVLRLSKGPNVIFGENEAGKSTVQWFIKGMLYSLKGGRKDKDGNKPPLVRFKPWENEYYRGSITYSLDNGSSFTVERDFNANITKVYDSFYNEIGATFDQDKGKGPLFALKHMGVNESCFERTALIGQMNVRLDAEGRKELAGRLSNICESGFEDISYKKAKEVLKEALISYVGTDRTTMRPINIVNKKLEELMTLKGDIARKRQEMFESLRQIDKFRSLREVLVQKKKVLEHAEQILSLRKDIGILKKQRRGLFLVLQDLNDCEKERVLILERIEKYKTYLKRHEGYLKYQDDGAGLIEVLYERLGETQKEKSRLYTNLEEIKKKIVDLENILGNRKETPHFDKNIFFSGWIFALPTLLLVVAILYFPVWQAKLILSSGFLFLFLMFLYFRKKKSKRVELSAELSDLYNNRETLKREIEIKREHVDAFKEDLLLYSRVSNDMERDIERLGDIKHRQEMICERSSLEYDLKHGDKAFLSNECEVISKKINRMYEEIESHVHAIRTLFVPTEDLGEHNKFLEKLLELNIPEMKSHVEKKMLGVSDDINKIEKKINETSALINSRVIDEEELQRVEVKIGEHEGKREKLLETDYSLKIAIKVLEEAGREIKREFTPALNSRLCDMIGMITGGKYSDISADDGLFLKAKEPKTSNITNMSLLSAGTIDQAYLVLRIALLEVIEAGNEALPLILDEAFAHYDDKRILSTFGMLRKKLQGRQIIIFTCKKRELEISQEIFGSDLNVIELP